MKIGKPVKDSEMMSTRGNYQEIYAAVMAAAPDWLPVTMADRDEAGLVRSAASAHRSRKFQARIKGCTVYLRVKPTNGATP